MDRVSLRLPRVFWDNSELPRKHDGRIRVELSREGVRRVRGRLEYVDSERLLQNLFWEVVEAVAEEAPEQWVEWFSPRWIDHHAELDRREFDGTAVLQASEILGDTRILVRLDRGQIASLVGTPTPDDVRGTAWVLLLALREASPGEEW